MHEDRPSIPARSLGSLTRYTDKAPRQYPYGRRCPCGTKLSVYNPDNTCSACTRKVAKR